MVSAQQWNAAAALAEAPAAAKTARACVWALAGEALDESELPEELRRQREQLRRRKTAAAAAAKRKEGEVVELEWRRRKLSLLLLSVCVLLLLWFRPDLRVRLAAVAFRAKARTESPF